MRQLRAESPRSGDRVGAGFFQRLSDWLTKRAGPVLFLGLALMAGLATGLSSLEVETHAERFLAPEHPSRQRYEAFKRDFGLDTAILVLIEAEDVFAPDFLTRLVAFHEALEDQLPHLDEVRSLASARLLASEGDLLSVGSLRKTMPRNVAESDRLAERLLRTSGYPDHLFSRDRTLTSVAIHLAAFSSAPESGTIDPSDADGNASLLTPSESAEVVRQVRAITAATWPEGRFHLTGNPVVNARLAAAFGRDLVMFTALALAAIASCLLLIFRRIEAVVLPLAVVMVSIAATLGAAGHLGMTINVTVQILPPFLLAIGASSSIHLLVLFFRHLDAGKTRNDALASALGHAGPALVVTSATTAAGLASFATATELAPVELLGRLAPLGVLMTLFAVLVLLPAALALIPSADSIAASRPERTPSRRIGRWLARAGLRALHSPRRVLAGVLIAFGISVVGLSRIEAANDALAYFPAGDPVRSATALFDDRLSGTLSMELVVEAGEPGGIQSPEVIAALDEAARSATALPAIDGARITRVLSIVDILREIHAALADPTTGAPDLPANRAMIAQELLLFEASGASDLERIVASDYSSARVTMRAPWVPAQSYLELIPQIEAQVGAALPDGLTVSTTGLIVLFAEAVEAISRAFVTSYCAALIMITLMMMGFLKSFRAGLASMVPNVLPIAITLGVMGLFRIDLDLFTMLIGSIAIGLAVDDTVHLSHAFRLGWNQHGDLERAVSEGLETTGGAILTSSIVLCLGFASFLFSPMSNLADFGLLTSISIALALAIDVIVLPPIFAWTVRTQETPVQASVPPSTRTSSPLM